MGYSERRESAHANGMVVAYGGTYQVPERYQRLIGKLTDETLYVITRRHKCSVTPEQLDRVIEASGGNKSVTSWLVRTVAQRGMEEVLGMSTDDFEGLRNVGARRLDALVALGVEDRRVKREPFTQKISGHFEGFVDGRPVSGHIEGAYTSDRSRDGSV